MLLPTLMLIVANCEKLVPPEARFVLEVLSSWRTAGARGLGPKVALGMPSDVLFFGRILFSRHSNKCEAPNNFWLPTS